MNSFFSPQIKYEIRSLKLHAIHKYSQARCRYSASHRVKKKQNRKFCFIMILLRRIDVPVSTFSGKYTDFFLFFTKHGAPMVQNVEKAIVRMEFLPSLRSPATLFACFRRKRWSISKANALIHFYPSEYIRNVGRFSHPWQIVKI